MKSCRSESIERERQKHRISEKLRNKGCICRDYLLKGACPRGTTCPYMHVTDGEVRHVPRHACTFFIKGICLRDECMFFHGTQAQLDSLHAQGAVVYRPQDYMQIAVPPSDYLNPDGSIKISDERSFTTSGSLSSPPQSLGSSTVLTEVGSSLASLQRASPSLPASEAHVLPANMPASATQHLPPMMSFQSLAPGGTTGVVTDGQRAYSVVLMPPSNASSPFPLHGVPYVSTAGNPSALQAFPMIPQQCVTPQLGFTTSIQHQEQMQRVPPQTYMPSTAGAPPHFLAVLSGAPQVSNAYLPEQISSEGRREQVLVQGAPHFHYPGYDFVAKPLQNL